MIGIRIPSPDFPSRFRAIAKSTIDWRATSSGCCRGDLEEAREYVLDRARRIEENDRVAVEDALGRVVAQDVTVPINVPGHANSAMDGYAVRAPAPTRSPA